MAQREPRMPKPPFEMETLTLALLLDGPNAAEFDDSEADRLLAEHLRYTIGLRDAGHLLAAGAIRDPGGAERMTGLGFSVLAPEELSSLVAEDPSMKAGLETFRVVKYSFPKGAIIFPVRPSSD